MGIGWNYLDREDPRALSLTTVVVVLFPKTRVVLAQLEHARNPIAHGIYCQMDNYCLFIGQISLAAVTPMGILLWALLQDGGGTVLGTLA